MLELEAVGVKRTAGMVAACAACCAALVGCGSSSATHKTTKASSSQAAKASTGSSGHGSCGTVPAGQPVVDQSGVLKSLGPQYVAAYSGLGAPVATSKWATWKPHKPAGGVTVGIAWSELANANQDVIYSTMIAALKASGIVSRVIPIAATSLSPAAAVQEYQSLVQKHVNLIIYQGAVPTAFAAPVSAAGAAGIPSINVNGTVPSPYSVNVLPNSYVSGAQGAAALFRLLGGNGNVLQINGLQGTSIATQSALGFSDALKLCPNIHVVGQVAGDYSPPMAETSTLQFLSSHPATLNGVWEAGTMSSAVVAAFEKLGRPVPAIAGSIAPAGFLAYWSSKAHSGFRGYVSQASPSAVGHAVADVATKMLKGDGVRVESIVVPPTAITSANLSGWTTTSDTQSQAAANGPASVTSEMQAWVNRFFKK